jgi:ribosome-associated heat shock protein Hsp15
LILASSGKSMSARKPARSDPSASAIAPSVRLDLWLWAARFFKTRALAKQSIEAGRVEVDGAGTKPATGVHAGVRLRISRGEERFEVDVRAVSERRGPASVAQALYSETEASATARAKAAEERRLHNLGYAKPATKPDKRARRLIHALGDIDAF